MIILSIIFIGLIFALCFLLIKINNRFKAIQIVMELRQKKLFMLTYHAIGIEKRTDETEEQFLTRLMTTEFDDYKKEEKIIIEKLFLEDFKEKKIKELNKLIDLF